MTVLCHFLNNEQCWAGNSSKVEEPSVTPLSYSRSDMAAVLEIRVVFPSERTLQSVAVKGHPSV